MIPRQQIFKYPRTRHIEGSRLQTGDEDLSVVPFESLRGCNLVLEEKVDGANCEISFTEDGELLLQSRGHYLIGSAREKQFNLLKQWASVHRSALFERLGAHLVMYGEWLYAKHTVFYNSLPHYFMEFDIFNKETGEFWSTPRRHELLEALPVVSVRVLKSGTFDSIEELMALVGASAFIAGDHVADLRAAAEARGIDPDQVSKETDGSPLMEGLYIKHEENGQVVGRYKWVRSSFLTAVADSESHWQSRPIIPNGLASGVNLFEL